MSWNFPSRGIKKGWNKDEDSISVTGWLNTISVTGWLNTRSARKSAAERELSTRILWTGNQNNNDRKDLVNQLISSERVGFRSQRIESLVNRVAFCLTRSRKKEQHPTLDVTVHLLGRFGLCINTEVDLM